ncbi:MAG: hypothetical protein JNK57_08095 [Planctomycetaceae bacterium]|nr:hypothetical protein [Planctomycetaceae bacterium]
MSVEERKLKNAKWGQPLLVHGMLVTRRLVHFDFFILQSSLIIQPPEPVKLIPELSTFEVWN